MEVGRAESLAMMVGVQKGIFIMKRRTAEEKKLDAGLPYDFTDPGVDGRKMHAVAFCRKLRQLQDSDASKEQQDALIRSSLGKVGKVVNILPGFTCDNGRNIFLGEDFLANYNVTILDIMPVRIGDHVMIGPNTLISTVNHPMTPMGRRKHLGIGSAVTIGNDVWIGGNATILPGVTIGNNVIVAAGAVVTKDIPDNTLVGGVPARKIDSLENDVE